MEIYYKDLKIAEIDGAGLVKLAVEERPRELAPTLYENLLEMQAMGIKWGPNTLCGEGATVEEKKIYLIALGFVLKKKKITLKKKIAKILKIIVGDTDRAGPLTPKEIRRASPHSKRIAKEHRRIKSESLLDKPSPPSTDSNFAFIRLEVK